jgi:hypothetical protein
VGGKMTAYDFLDKHYFSGLFSVHFITLILLALLCFKIGLIQYILGGVKFVFDKVCIVSKKILEHREKMAEFKVRELKPGSICVNPDALKSDQHRVFFDGTQRFKTFIKNGKVVKREDIADSIKGPIRTIQYDTKIVMGKAEVYIFIESRDTTNLRMINNEPYIVKKLDWENDFQRCPDE